MKTGPRWTALNDDRRECASESFLSLYLNRRFPPGARDAFPTLEELKRDYIGYLMSLTGENVDEVASILQLPKKELALALSRARMWL